MLHFALSFSRIIKFFALFIFRRICLFCAYERIISRGVDAFKSFFFLEKIDTMKRVVSTIIMYELLQI